MQDKKQQYDITRILLSVLLLAGLLFTSFWVLQPFLPATIWAVMIVIATWNFMLMVQSKLNNSRKLAVLVMSLALILILVIPLTTAIWAIGKNVSEVGHQVREIATKGLPQPPVWLSSVPFVGEKLAVRWQEAAGVNREEMLSWISPHVGWVVSWFLQQAGSLGQILLHFLLTVIISAILYANGEVAAAGVRKFARTLANERGESALVLAAQAIRAVASGVIITAIIQALMTGIGLFATGTPYAIVLASVTFLLCVIQVGAAPVLISVLVWLFYSGSQFAAWAFLVWSIIIMISDNMIRPFLIKRGANLPLILIFAGVIGGLLAFGIIGIFIGPVVLAVGYTWLKSWVEGQVGPEKVPS